MKNSELIFKYLLAKNIIEENPNLKEHIQALIEKVTELKEFIDRNNLNETLPTNLFKSLVKAAILHDLGKINYRFQKKVWRSKLPPELDYFLKKTKKIDIRHEFLSLVWSIILLGNEQNDLMIRTSILLHHYNEYFIEDKSITNILRNPFYREQIKNYIEFLLDSEKREIIKIFLEKLLNDLKFYKYDFVKEAVMDLEKNLKDGFSKLESFIKALEEGIDFAKYCKLYRTPHSLVNLSELQKKNLRFFTLLLGLLRRCDYAASGHITIEYLQPSLRDFYKMLESKLNDLARRSWGIKNGLKGMWQYELLEKLSLGKEGLNRLILVAPTGSGKTEFALLWIGKLKKKLIYTLPLRVALNDIYMRLKKYFIDNNELVGLLHSTAFIEYLREGQNKRELGVEEKILSARLLSNTVNLSTPDQVLLTSLNYYGSDKIIATYPLTGIVIDEIQTYNSEMAAIIYKTLKVADEMGSSILIITATYPPYFKKIFEKLGIREIDVANYDIKDKVKNYNIKRHRIKMEDIEIFPDENDKDNKIIIKEAAYRNIINYINNWLSRNKRKILFVVNNVSKAIALYKRLKKDPSFNQKTEIYLLHSRLLELEKNHRINKIKDRIKQNKPIILVATQVIEASIDLDFDSMITELSTIDSQIQRWGRVYRNRKQDYRDDQPNIIIFKSLDKRSCAIYDKKILEATLKILKKHDKEILNYYDERKLIDEVFNEEINGKSLKDIYEKEIEEILMKLQYFTVEKKTEAQKLFRQIAGITVVFPEIMIKSQNELERELGKILLNSKEITWKNIYEEFKDKWENFGLRKETAKWKFLEILYQYSINIPIPHLKKLSRDFKQRYFKGFRILIINDEDILKQIREYGADILFRKN